jgi:hypothetical protein
MTPSQLILMPVFLHVLLIFFLGIRTAIARGAAIRNREVRIKEIVLDNRGWPERARKLSNNFDNQFQVPMIWYALVALLVATNLVDTLQVVLAWCFVATRVVHSYIHTGANDLRLRLFAFLAGATIVFLMWLWFALSLYGLA